MAAKTRDELIDAIAASVDALVKPMSLTRTVAGVTEAFVLPNLLEQLGETMSRKATSGDMMGGSTTFRSSAPVSAESLDGLLEIERTVDHWQNLLGVSWRVGVEDRLRGILGNATVRHDLALLKGIAYDFARMVTIASVLTEWESEPFKPQATCPLCEARGTLRIREATKTAMCVQCRQHWTPDTLGLLAEYVRADNERREAERRTRLGLDVAS